MRREKGKEKERKRKFGLLLIFILRLVSNTEVMDEYSVTLG